MQHAADSRPADAEAQRLFVAVPLPEGVRQVLETLPEKVAGVTWSNPAQWHLTLRFLGNVGVETRDALVTRLEAIRVEPFVLPIEGVGTFPPKARARVIWVGTGAGHPRLHQLRQKIDDAAIAAGREFDVRTFHPHVTLARCNDDTGPGLAQWLHSHRAFEAPPFRVDAFGLYRSELKASGAVHTLVARIPLLAP